MTFVFLFRRHSLSFINIAYSVVPGSALASAVVMARRLRDELVVARFFPRLFLTDASEHALVAVVTQSMEPVQTAQLTRQTF